jgi:hypothetical protein
MGCVSTNKLVRRDVLDGFSRRHGGGGNQRSMKPEPFDDERRKEESV